MLFVVGPGFIPETGTQLIVGLDFGARRKVAQVSNILTQTARSHPWSNVYEQSNFAYYN